MSFDKTEMSRRHELTLTEVIGGRRTKGSGSQWTDQMDARAHHLDVPFAFAVECKSTGGQSIAVTLEMIKKALDQAGGERPAIALRFYANERLDVRYDFVAVQLADFREMMELLNRPMFIALNPSHYEWTDEQREDFRARLDELAAGPAAWVPHPVDADAERMIELRAEKAELARELEEVRGRLGAYEGPEAEYQPEEAVKALQEELAARPAITDYNNVLGQLARAEAASRAAEQQLQDLRAIVTTAEADSLIGLARQNGNLQRDVSYLRQLVAVQAAQLQAGAGRRNELQRTMIDPPPEGPDGNPVYPWTVVFKETGADNIARLHAVRYDATGTMSELNLREVRVHNTIGQEQRIYADNVNIGYGAFYSDGRLICRVVPLVMPKNSPPVNPLDQN